MTEVGFEPRQYSYRAYIPTHLAIPILYELYDGHGHQNNMPSSKSQPRRAVQQPALREKSITALFWTWCFHQSMKGEMARSARVHACFLSRSPARGRLNGRQRQAPWQAGRQAGTGTKNGSGRGKHKAFCEGENGTDFPPQRGYPSYPKQGSWEETYSLLEASWVACKTPLPEKRPAIYSYLGERRL